MTNFKNKLFEGGIVILGVVMLVLFLQAEPQNTNEVKNLTNNLKTEENQIASFSKNDKLVATYYFYWYNNKTKRHIEEDGSDELTTHPPKLEGFSYENIDWHKKQLRDMTEIGIDIILPVYFGNPANKVWSITGLKKLVKAYDQLKEEGVENLPKIGMFYDTHSMMYQLDTKPDLTKEDNLDLFYKLVNDFYSIIPTEYRARIENQPIIWFYVAGYVKEYKPNIFNYLEERFKNDFEEKGLYVVKESSWEKAESDDVYKWGAALNGPTYKSIISLGPGFDNSAVQRKSKIRERENGEFYENSWKRALVKSKYEEHNIIAIETWNEYHEGTNISDCKEYGRKYLNLSKKYIEKFKKGILPQNYPGEKYFNTDKVSINFTNINNNKGIKYIEVGDGKNEVIEYHGFNCLKPLDTKHKGKYMYFKINPMFKINKGENYKITVEYYDSDFEEFILQYDSTDNSAPIEGAYKSLEPIMSRNTEEWRRETFIIKDAKFEGRQNDGADFRIKAFNKKLYIKSISIENMK